MLIPIVLINLAGVSLFLTIIAFGGIMLWHGSRIPLTTTVRPHTTFQPQTTVCPTICPTVCPSTISPWTTTIPSSTISPTSATTSVSSTTSTSTSSTITSPSSTMTFPSSTVTSPSSTMTFPSSTVTSPSSTITSPSSTITSPSSTITSPSSTITSPRSTITSPSSTVTSPSSTITSPSSITTPASTITSSSTIISTTTECPTICPTVCPTVFPNPTDNPYVPHKICMTIECIIADQDLKQKIKLELNPCKNFYNFACGKLQLHRNKMKNYEFTLPKELIDSRFNEILKEPESPKDLESLNLARVVYQRCMNGGLSDDLIKLYSDTEDFNWIDWATDTRSVLAHFYQKAVDVGYVPRSLFVIDIAQHPHNRDEKIIFIRKPKPSSDFNAWPLDVVRIDFEYLLDWIRKKGYKNHEEKIGGDTYKRQEMEVAKIYDEFPEEKPVILSLLALDVETKTIPWRLILDRVFKPMIISQHQNILVECVPCLKKLTESFVLRNLPILQTYLIRNAYADNILDTSEDIVDEWFYKKSVETNNGNFRPLFCTSKVVSLFRKVTDYEYIQRHLNRRLKDDLEKLIYHLKFSLKNVLMATRYLDPQTMQRALDKLASMRFYTPLDDDMNDADKINRYYANVPFDPRYRQLLINIRKRTMENTIYEFNDNSTRPIKSSQFMIGEEYVHYDLSSNSVLLSASSFANPLFSGHRSEFLNFGALGSIITYGITRGFNGEGRLYDETGNQTDWWKKETKDVQDEKAQCFIDSYTNHTHEIPDKKKASEIVTENDAAQIAYYAYRAIRVNLNNQKDQRLPSFRNFSDGQMFWISYASMTCSKDPEQSKTDDYIQPSILINEVVANNYYFSEDFECKSNDEMNPMKKCNLWLPTAFFI